MMRSWIIPACAGVLFFGAIILVAPWGNFPINDDWQYALVAKRFLDQLSLDVVVPVAPTLLGQTLFVYPWIKATGFSHLFLRVFTIALSVAILCWGDFILRKAGVRRVVRGLALGTIAFNVLHFVLSLSFMTEIYGFFWMFAAVWLWLSPGSAWGRWMAIAVCAVIAFWTRQFAFLWFVAILMTDVLAERSMVPSGYSLRSVLVSLGSQKARLLSIGFCALGVLGYFIWSQSTHVIKGEFTTPLRRILTPSPLTMISEAAMAVYYLTLFCLPLLVVFAPDSLKILTGRRQKWQTVALIGAVVTVAGIAVLAANRLAHGEFQLWTRPFFPFKGNLLNHYGVGPLTTTDAFFATSPDGLARIPDAFWYFLELALAACMFLWLSPLRRLREILVTRDRPWGTGERLEVFGWGAAILNFLVVVMAFRHEIIDRYYYGSFLALVLGLSVHCGRMIAERTRGGVILSVAGAIGVAMAVSVTCLTHDFFRWQEARQAAYQGLLERGVGASEVDGGFEPNGWAAYSLDPKKAKTDPCYSGNWFCPTRPFGVGVLKNERADILQSYEVPAWIAPNRMIFELKTHRN